MASSFETDFEAINASLSNLRAAEGPQDSLVAAVAVANSVLSLLRLSELREPGVVIDEHVIQLPNAERQDGWFQKHPWMQGTRAAFELCDCTSKPLQAKMYWLNKKSASFTAGAVHFTPNWEDHDFTRNNNYKIGVDFFLAPDAKSIQVVLANRESLRVLELADKLLNTQVTIFEAWRSAQEISDVSSLHDQLWSSFELQSVNKAFYEGVAAAFSNLHDHLVTQNFDERAAKLFSSRLLSRVIFVWFLRKMNLISAEVPYFDLEEVQKEGYYQRLLEPLFFEILDVPTLERLTSDRYPANSDDVSPYLGGGLFSETPDDLKGHNLSFPVTYFQDLFEHFSKFNFTTDESTPDFEQVAIDPEMLGRVFESLLAAQTEESGEIARKAKGAFYTPREIVTSICRTSLKSYLLNALAGETWGVENYLNKLLETSEQDWARAGTNSLRDFPSEIRVKLIDAILGCKSLDPACGSGAFPMGMLQVMTRALVRLGSKLSLKDLKLQILEKCIFGADIEPMAVDIARTRFWLSLVVESDPEAKIEPLPNLEFKFVSANSLILLASESQTSLFEDPALEMKLRDIRSRYFEAKDRQTKLALKAEFTQIADGHLLVDFASPRAKQLKTFRPFESDSTADFFDPMEMFGVDNFEVIIGNPPYVDSEFMAKHQPEFREYIRHKYQTARGNWDLYVPFIERAMALLNSGGVMSFIVKNSLINANYCQSVRNFITDYSLEEVIEFGKAKIFESADVYTCIFRVTKSNPGAQTFFTSMDSPTSVVERSSISQSSLKKLPSWKFCFLPTEVRTLVSRLQKGQTLVSLGFTSNGAATVGEAYEIAAEIYENANPGPGEFKLINTGSIDPFITTWGQRPTRYLKNSYLHPVVNKSSLLKINPTRATQASRPKIVVIGMGNVEAFLDATGEYCAGKSTSILFSQSDSLEDLMAVTALLNSRVSRFWFKNLYLAAGMGGIGPKDLLTLPLPLTYLEARATLASKTQSGLANLTDEFVDELAQLCSELYEITQQEVELL